MRGNPHEDDTTRPYRVVDQIKALAIIKAMDKELVKKKEQIEQKVDAIQAYDQRHNAQNYKLQDPRFTERSFLKPDDTP